jgi:hypothetical protein
MHHLYKRGYRVVLFTNSSVKEFPLREEVFPHKDGEPEERENGVNYTKRAILQIMKEALYGESSRFTF